MAKPKLDSAGISLFCESVAMMLAAGIQTDEAVGMLSEDIGDVALQATCESVYGRLCAGDTLAVAMKASGAFPRYAVDMVGVGEASGRLEEVLRSLGVYYDEEDRLFAKIRSSVGYPAALLCIMSIILAFTVIIILPVFEDVYVSMAGSLTDGSSGAVGVSVAIGWVALGITLICAIVAVGAAIACRSEAGLRQVMRCMWLSKHPGFPIAKNAHGASTSALCTGRAVPSPAYGISPCAAGAPASRSLRAVGCGSRAGAPGGEPVPRWRRGLPVSSRSRVPRRQSSFPGRR